MAVAVKNPPVSAASSPFDRMPVVSLAGAAYVLGSLGIVFGLLPYLWRAAVGLTGVSGDVVLGLLMLAAATGLGILGVRLIGPKQPAGARAGIFVGIVLFLVVLLLTRWASLWVEYWVHNNHWLGDSVSAGLAVTGLVGLLLLVGEVYLFFRPETEKYLVKFEAQGWFTATSYKGQQGQRVRRGTILGLLLIAGSGVYTMMNNGFLRRLPENWTLNIPFTGVVTVETPGDAGPLLKELAPQAKEQVQIVDEGASGFPRGAVVSLAAYRKALKDRIEGSAYLSSEAKTRLEKELDAKDVTEILNLPGAFESLTAVVGPEALLTLPPPGLPRAELRLDGFALRNVNDQLARDYVRVTNTRYVDLKEDAVIPVTKYKELLNSEDLRNVDEKDRPVAEPPLGAYGPVSYQTLTLLPALRYTFPLLLLAASLWLAWRVVSFPPFADFLIATEAELNKVSWTTRKRLIQDTIVVLVTVALMAMFLFLMDQTWRVVLSWKPIGVLQISEDQSDKNKNADQKPW